MGDVTVFLKSTLYGVIIIVCRDTTKIRGFLMVFSPTTAPDGVRFQD